MRFGRVPKREKAKILAAMQSSKAKIMESRVLNELLDERKIIDTIVRAHYDTCDYTSEKMKPFILKAQTRPNLTQCTGQVGTLFIYFFNLLCYMNILIFRERWLNAFLR